MLFNWKTSVCDKKNVHKHHVFAKRLHLLADCKPEFSVHTTRHNITVYLSRNYDIEKFLNLFYLYMLYFITRETNDDKRIFQLISIKHIDTGMIQRRYTNKQKQ